MAEKNLEQFIAEKETEFQTKSEKIEKKKKRFKKKLLIFGIIFAVLVVGCFVGDLMTKNNSYNRLKDANITDTEAMKKIAESNTAIVHTDIFDKFEAGYLGNKSMNSINYGMMAENQYGYTYINETGEVVLHAGNKDNVIATEQISQINIAKNLVIYKGTDKKIYTCQYDGSDKNTLISDKVGTVLLVGDDLYYINISNSNNVYRYNLTSKESKVVVEKSVSNFTVAANKILYLDFDNHLMLQNLNSASTSWSNSNVVKFFFNGEVFVQNNDKVIKFNINNHYPKDVATGINELLGVDESFVYYTIGNKLYSQDLNTGDKKELSYNFDYYKGVYSINDKIKALGGELE